MLQQMYAALISSLYRPASNVSQELFAITDATFKCNEKSNSVRDTLIYYCDSLVEYTTGIQSSLSHSALESELVQMYEVSKRLIFFLGLIKSLIEKSSAFMILTDALTIIQSVTRPVRKRLQHVGLSLNHMCREIGAENLKLLFIGRDQNLADTLVKQLSPEDLFLNVRDIWGFPCSTVLLDAADLPQLGKKQEWLPILPGEDVLLSKPPTEMIKKVAQEKTSRIHAKVDRAYALCESSRKPCSIVLNDCSREG